MPGLSNGAGETQPALMAPGAGLRIRLRMRRFYLSGDGTAIPSCRGASAVAERNASRAFVRGAKKPLRNSPTAIA